MPWQVTSPMDQRLQFVREARRQHDDMAAICRRFGISRKTGYKWLNRYEEGGVVALEELSRRPHHSPQATEAAVLTAVLEVRRHHPTWGGKKLAATLMRRWPSLRRCAPSTIALLLKRHGLITSSRRRRALAHPGRPSPLSSMTEPNAVWTADFKGQFPTRDGVLCYPLTVADGASRFLLACRALPSVRTRDTKPMFERLFRERGLPDCIRTDNGVPFATIALARLSPLSVWWIRLGIRPELIQPGHPEQNGRHERMHRTMKAETQRPPAGSRTAQQRAFDRFRNIFNEERPHEALGQQTPAMCYRESLREFPSSLPPLEYPSHWEVRRVSSNGGVRWHKHWVNVSHVLGLEDIAFEETGDGLWDVHFGPLVLGHFHERLLRIEDANGKLARNRNRPVPVLPMSLD
jgi:putative transposase